MVVETSEYIETPRSTMISGSGLDRIPRRLHEVDIAGVRVTGMGVALLAEANLHVVESTPHPTSGSVGHPP